MPGCPSTPDRPVGPELPLDPVGRTDRDREQPVVAERAMPGDRGLHEMADAVELVPPGEVAVWHSPADDLDVAVEVAVRSLRGSHNGDRLVRSRGQICVLAPAELPTDRLEPLVHIGVEEGKCEARGVSQGPIVAGGTGREAKISQRSAAVELVESVRDRVSPVDLQALRPEAVDDLQLRRLERPQAGPCGRGGPHRTGAHFTAPLMRPDT